MKYHIVCVFDDYSVQVQDVVNEEEMLRVVEAVYELERASGGYGGRKVRILDIHVFKGEKVPVKCVPRTGFDVYIEEDE